MIKEPQFIVDPNGNIKGVKKKNQFKDFVIEYFKVVFLLLSIVILLAAMCYPVLVTTKEYKEYLWTGWVIYPLMALVIAALPKIDLK